MRNNQDVEVFDPTTPPGGTATTVVSKLPPNGAGHPAPWPNHEDIGLYPHMFVLPSTTELGEGGDKVLVAGPGVYDSAVIDTTTWRWTDVVAKPDTGQRRLSQDRSWGTAWLEPGGVEGSDDFERHLPLQYAGERICRLPDQEGLRNSGKERIEPGQAIRLRPAPYNPIDMVKGC